MPISGKYEWQEDEESVKISIPLKGSSPNTVDIFVAETILKVNFAPYLIDLNLFDTVDDERSKAIVKDGTLLINLIKKERQTWGRLIFKGSKEEIHLRRAKALEHRQQRNDNVRDETKKIKWQEERATLRSQMALEQSERQRIDELKASEKEKAEKEVYESFIKLEKENAKKKESISRKPPKKIAIAKKEYFKCDTKCLKDTEDVQKSRSTITDASATENDTMEEFEETTLLPPPRAFSTITFKHTPRIFKTPVRESTRVQENDFIAKNRPYLKNHPHLHKDELLDVADVDPLWLKRKGDNFFQNADYRSAINAYSSAFEADDGMIPALMNRSVCYMLLGESERCIADGTDAIALLDKTTGMERDELKIKALIRVGVAYVQMSDVGNSLNQFQQALNMSPNNHRLHFMVDRLTHACRGQDAKKRGDRAFGEGRIEYAIECYDETLRVFENDNDDDTESTKDQTKKEEETYEITKNTSTAALFTALLVGALANRASCHFAIKRINDCVADCSRALTHLSSTKRRNAMNVSTAVDSLSPFFFPRELNESVDAKSKRRKWVVSLLCKRGAAFSVSSEWGLAVKDLEMARTLIADHDEMEAGIILKDIESLRGKIRDCGDGREVRLAGGDDTG